MSEFDTTKPIYYQLAERIFRQIMRKELSAGSKLPSVREFAVESGVNPNTVQRTYRELESMGIVETRRGQGTFVTEDETVLLELRKTLKQDYISTFVQDMREMGFTSGEILSGLKEYMEANQEEGTDDD